MVNERSKLVDVEERERTQSVGDQTEMCYEKGSAHMWFTVLVSITAPILWGWTIGYTSPTFSVSSNETHPYDLNVVFDISDNQKAWLSSSIMLAGGVGGLFGGIPVDKYGKKAVMITCNALFLIGYILFKTTPAVDAGASNKTQMVQLLAARVIMGLAGGLTCMSVPAYTAEIAPLQQRGLIGCVFQVGVNAGLSLVYGLGYFVHWDDLCIVAMGLASVGLIGGLMVPESPQWLINKGARVEAEAAIKKLRTPDSDTHTLLNNYTVVKTQSEEDLAAKGDIVGELLKYPRNKALAIALGLVFTQQFSGINVVMCFGGEIIGKVYPDPDVANKYALIMQLMMFGMVVFASAIMPLFNRRTFLIAAEIGMLISFGLMIVYFFNEDTVAKEVVLIGYFAFPLTFSFGMGSIPWLALGELLHPRVRGLASAICTFASWLASFFTVQTVGTFQNIFGKDKDDGRGIGGLFAMYACISFLGMLFIIFFLPETRDKSYNAVERQLTGAKKQAEQENGGDEF